MKRLARKKLKLLLWKNWMIQKRHKMQTIVEIVVPVAFAGLLILIRSLVEPFTEHRNTVFRYYPLETLPTLPRMSDVNLFWGNPDPIIRSVNKEIVYTPINVRSHNIMSYVAHKLGVSTKGVHNVNELEKYAILHRSLAGVVFEDISNSDSLTTVNLICTIRFPSELRSFPYLPVVFNWMTNLLYPMFPTNGPRNSIDGTGGAPPGYYVEGFLQIQHAIAKAVLEPFKNISKMPVLMNKVKCRRFPYPPYTQDILLSGLEIALSFIILLSYVYTCINTVKFITSEKEKKLKETMRIMGLDCWLHWLAWFIRSMILLTISNVLIIILFKVSWFPDSKASVFTYSSATALFAFFTIYSMSITTYCFMISTFFSRANTASSVSGIVWLIFYFPYMATQKNYLDMNLFTKIFISLFHNSSMGVYIKLVIFLEGKTDGVQWTNLFRPATPKDNFTPANVWFMLIFDTFLYLFIALYVEKIMPGDVGVPEPWNFVFKKKFWFKNYNTENVEGKNVKTKMQNNENMESDPANKYAGVQIKNLKKIYENKKIAVHGLSINMYEDQITVLLGHNGAGKTTTMSMLAGMFPPTSGTAIINGKDLRTDINGVRESLGICPQYNVLFDELTVREHIIFFSKLKGVQDSLVESEIIKYVNLLDIQKKTHAQSATLSGGMKRKLSMAIALCGGSKVVLCDEPTSGMDPSARRALWEVFQQEKKGRTILLSTHFMDEADILGDRIAIMSGGELKCCGTSFFLKKKFGLGYHLICVKASLCKPTKLTKLLRTFVPTCNIESDIGTELSYQLSEVYIQNFPKMLTALESHQKSLGVSSYGLSLTTLEEVFMRVGSDVPEEVYQIYKENLTDFNSSDTSSSSGSSDAEYLLNRCHLVINQIEAMFLKKFYYACKTWLLLVLQNLIPFVFVIVAFIVVHAGLGSSTLPPLKISLMSYPKSVTVITTINNDSKSLYNAYIQIIKQIPNMDYKLLNNYNIIDYLLKLRREHMSDVNENYIIGLELLKDKLGAYYNNHIYHSPALSLNMLHNAALKSINEDFSLTIINHPFKFTESSRLQIMRLGNNFGFTLATNLGFGMAFVSSFYVLFYIKERESRAKLLQFVSGVNVFTFWITALLWDLLTFTITCFVIVFTLVLFQENGFKTMSELGRCFLLLFLFGWAMLPIHYLTSMLFSIPSSGFTRMSMFNIFTGVAFFIVSYILSLEIFHSEDIADIMVEIGVFFPHFLLTQGFNNMYTMSSYLDICKDACQFVGPNCTFEFLCKNLNKTYCCDLDYNNWSPPGIKRNFYNLFFIGCISFVILLIKDISMFDFVMFFMKKIYESKNIPKREDRTIDNDVLAENRKVSFMTLAEIKNYNLVVKEMTKFYNKFLAVNCLSVALDQAECFGLLGINGAGKTTTFKMLTGDEKMSSGNAWINGISLKKNLSQVYREIGYCPQFDALLEDLTGREILRIFCLLRGISRSKIDDVSVFLAFELNFAKYIDKRVKEYSGGNKRKLSTALALIGSPPVVYLDEPTTGMDPGSKRHLWNVICNVRNMGRTIVLTTHYMEECEALCTRIAIMVNGEFKCIGSTQHLKNKFSQGLTLTIKTLKPLQKNKTDDIYKAQKAIITSIKDYMNVNFSEAVLKEEFQGLITYFISGKVQWSTMFAIMETAKSLLQIEDYAIVQTSLEQVFLSFAKRQISAPPIRKSMLIKFVEK